jgi:PHD/YefM family antitoxin component YafN of YafNO toxin-antitoxin module
VEETVDKKQDTAKETRVAYKVDDLEDAVPAIALHEQYVVDREGKKVGVILPFEQYLQMKEDLHDLATVAERRDEVPISLEEMKRRLKEDGLL